MQYLIQLLVSGLAMLAASGTGASATAVAERIMGCLQKVVAGPTSAAASARAADGRAPRGSE